MNLLEDNGKLNFIIDLPYGFGDHLTGGLLAMHYLAYQLAKRGQNVYIFCKPEYPHENIHTIKNINRVENGTVKRDWELFLYNLTNTIAVYPEISLGNPFNTKHVARWLLYESQSEIEKTWGENDCYFNYGTFKTLEGKEQHPLTVMDFHFEVFQDRGREDRKGFCHILHKNTTDNSRIMMEELGSKGLGDWKSRGCFKYLVEEFNKYEYFVTYDEKSFFTVAAALCGCKSIICNPKNLSNVKEKNINYKGPLTPTEYRLENPLQMFGVAYGFNDLKWAHDTVHLVRKHLIKRDRMNNKTIDKFIEFWEKKCYG